MAIPEMSDANAAKPIFFIRFFPFFTFYSLTATASKRKTPPRAYRRGDWYARKETRRGDEIGIVRPKDAPRQSVFALCLPSR